MPHWKYVEKTRIFRLLVPRGYTSAMFTHPTWVSETMQCKTTASIRSFKDGQWTSSTMAGECGSYSQTTMTSVVRDGVAV
jgi:hypothetical protein